LTGQSFGYYLMPAVGCPNQARWGPSLGEMLLGESSLGEMLLGEPTPSRFENHRSKPNFWSTIFHARFQ
jgi:hypothetical protein